MAAVPVLAMPASAAADYSTAPVLITVGDAKVQFYVHEPLLRSSSKFFDAALNKEWREGQTRTIDLPESDPDAFKVYVNWLYSGRLFIDDEPSVPRDNRAIYELLVQTYILGDKVVATDFKDSVTDAAANDILTTYEDSRYVIGVPGRRLLYENTVPNAPLRRLVVRALTMLDMSASVKEYEPGAFLHDVIQAMARNDAPTLDGFAKELADCKYHEHEAGAEHCYRNKRR